MLFFLLMQPNHIETLNRKVCMRINDDYYMENVFTLIRVPNDNSKSDEFASRYFCLQSNLTHKVYVVWKRRNQIKRINKNIKLNTDIKCEKSKNLIKNISIRSKCKLINLSNKLIEKKLIKPINKDKVKKLSKNSFIKFNFLKSNQLNSSILIEEFKNDNQINNLLNTNQKDQINNLLNTNQKDQINLVYEKSSKIKKSTKLFKIIKNRLNSNDKIKSTLNKPKYSDLNKSDFNNDKIENDFKIKDNQSKLSNFINKLSNKAGNTVQYLFKDDKKIKNVKKKMSSTFKNIRHNLVNLMIKKSKID